MDGTTSFSAGLRRRNHFFTGNILQWMPEPVKSSLQPPRTCKGWLNFFMLKIPILQWVWSYKVNYLIGDIVAGITVAIIVIPQGLAYALLANMAPIYGLYAGFTSPILYAVFGTSRQASVGTFAVVQLILGNSIEQVFSEHDSLQNCSISASEGNDTEVMFEGEVTTCETLRLDIVITLAFLSGTIMILMGIFQFGFVTIFLSEPMVSGYTTGAAVQVFSSQLQHITGLGDTIRVSQGLFKMPRIWIAMLQNVASISGATIIISATAITFMIIIMICNKLLSHPRSRIPIKIYRHRERRWIRKLFHWPFPIPSQLIVVVVATLISHFAMLQERYDVKLVGNVPNGLPGTSLPNFKLASMLMKDALVISIITFSVSVSVAKVIAHQFGYKINSNQEFLALGLVNFIGSFFSTFSSSGGLSRTNIQAYSGGKTQLAGIISASVVMVVLLKLGSLFQPLPKAILGAITWVALYGTFKQVKDVYKYFKLSAWDGVVWLAVFFSTVLLGVAYGLAIGVTFSLLALVLRIILPSSSALGHKYGNFRKLDNFENVELSPGVVLFRFPAPLCFVNSLVFQQQLEVACDLHVQWHSRRTARMLCYKKEDAYFTVLDNSVVEDDGESHRSVYAVIIDCFPLAFIDAVGVKVLEQILEDFERLEIQVLFAGMTEYNRRMIMKSKYFVTCDKVLFFPSILAAVRHVQLSSD